MAASLMSVGALPSSPLELGGGVQFGTQDPVRPVVGAAAKVFRLKQKSPENELVPFHRALATGNWKQAYIYFQHLPASLFTNRAKGFPLFRILFQDPRNLPFVENLAPYCSPAICKAITIPIVQRVPPSLKAQIAESFLSRWDPEDLRAMGISVPFFQAVKSHQASSSDREQFLQEQKQVPWTRLDREARISPLGMAIFLCSCTEEYQAVVLDLIDSLSIEELQMACFGKDIRPLHYAVICEAQHVFSVLYNKLPSSAWTAHSDQYPSPLDLLIALSTPQTKAASVLFTQEHSKYFPSKVYQKSALAMIARLPIELLQRIPLAGALASEQDILLKALLKRGVSYKISPAGAEAWLHDPKTCEIYISQTILDRVFKGVSIK